MNNEALPLSEADDLVTLQQVRDVLGEEVAQQISEADLNQVRLQAAEVLSKIPDADLRARSAKTVIQTKWQRLSCEDQKALLKEAFFAARKLFFRVNKGRGQFYKESHLEGPMKYRVDRRLAGPSMDTTFFTEITAKINKLIERFGPDPIGKWVYCLTDSGIVRAQIASVTKDGQVNLRNQGGNHSVDNLSERREELGSLQ